MRHVWSYPEIELIIFLTILDSISSFKELDPYSLCLKELEFNLGTNSCELKGEEDAIVIDLSLWSLEFWKRITKLRESKCVGFNFLWGCTSVGKVIWLKGYPIESFMLTLSFQPYHVLDMVGNSKAWICHFWALEYDV